jgi:hypothetical protein
VVGARPHGTEHRPLSKFTYCLQKVSRDEQLFASDVPRPLGFSRIDIFSKESR